MHAKNKKILLDVPYYSQRLDIKDKFWRSRACGIVALAMGMNYLAISPPRLAEDVESRRALQGGVRGGKANSKIHPFPIRGLPLGKGEQVRIFISRLISDGQMIGARDPKFGWIHNGLVKLAKRHGFKKSFRKEWKENQKQKALSYMIVLLRHHMPVLVSMRTTSGLPRRKAGGHLVLLIGFRHLAVRRLSGFYYHDPDAYSRKSGAYKYISTKKFLHTWKGRIIVVRK